MPAPGRPGVAGPDSPANPKPAEYLKQLKYECVNRLTRRIGVRARTSVLSARGKPDPVNNLLAFLYDLAACSQKPLLATATLVQLYPSSLGPPHVLGLAMTRARNA